MSVEENAVLEERLDKLPIRKLIMFDIWETRSIRKLITNHLRHHELGDNRRWKLYLLLFGSFLATIGGCAVALFTFLL